MKKKAETKVYTWGIGKNGQLGIDLKKCYGTNKINMLPSMIQKLPSTKQICCFTNFSMILTEEGNVYSFGSNHKGRLGLGPPKSDGPQKPDESDYFTPQLVPLIKNIVKIECGVWHSIALDQTGQAFSAGYNGYGELGRPLKDDQHGPYVFGPVN